MERPYSYEFISKATYKGVEFIFAASSVTGGKKTATKEFVNSDYQLIEELGKKQRGYSVSAFVALVGEEADYITKRDAILQALESPGEGTFVHPVHGIIENCIVTSYSINESMDEVGIGSLQIEFGITNISLGPVQDVLTPSAVVQTNEVVMAQSQTMIEDGFDANPKLLGVYNSAKAKLVKIGEAFDSSVKFAVKKADDVTKAITKPTDELSNTIAGFQRDVVTLATNPIRLAASITNVFNTISATIATASSAYEVYESFFGFGWAEDIELRFDTIANQTKNNNSRVLNDTMNAVALSGAYLFAVQKDYKTIDEIDADVLTLENQLKAIEEREGVDSDLLASLWDARQTTMELLAAARLNASSVIEIEVENVSARSLSYLYYGDDSRASEIARLNMGSGIIFDDTVKILSK